MECYIIIYIFKMKLQGLKVKRIRPYQGCNVSSISSLTCVFIQCLIVYGRTTKMKMARNDVMCNQRMANIKFAIV